MQKTTIAIDVMGGDYAPEEVVLGAIEAANEFPVKLLLVGDESKVTPLIKNQGNVEIEVIPARELIGSKDNPVQSIKEKPESSIVIGTKLVRDGKAQAFTSAGNTGAMAAAAIFILGMLEGIKRPALCSNINIAERHFILLDVGANADCRPLYLAQFGFLGTVLAITLKNIEAPKVFLLNNGEEENKGNMLTKDAHQLLRQSKLNFCGNIEGQELFSGKADVVVTDGYTGNVMLKLMEGIAGLFMNKMNYVSGNNSKQNIGLNDDLLRVTMKNADYKEHGGAMLIGVNGNIVISHGRSRAKATKNAIRSAYELAISGLISKLKNSLGSPQLIST